MPAGRKPIKFDVEKIQLLASRGLTEKQIMVSIGVGSSSFYLAKKKYKEFSQALEKGKASGLAEVANALYQAAVKGNTTAQIFYLKTRGERGQWPDRQEITGPDGVDFLAGFREAVQYNGVKVINESKNEEG